MVKEHTSDHIVLECCYVRVTCGSRITFQMHSHLNCHDCHQMTLHMFVVTPSRCQAFGVLWDRESWRFPVKYTVTHLQLCVTASQVNTSPFNVPRFVLFFLLFDISASRLHSSHTRRLVDFSKVAVRGGETCPCFVCCLCQSAICCAATYISWRGDVKPLGITEWGHLKNLSWWMFM